MDACLDTLSDELCQVNTHVGHIARRQAVMGGFDASLPPTLEAYGMRMMIMILLLPMIRMMEMLAFSVLTRCLLDTLTLCHS